MGDAVVGPSAEDEGGSARTRRRGGATSGSRRTSRGLVLVAVGAVTLLLAACSNSSGQSTAATAPAGTTGGTTPVAAADLTEKVAIEGVPGVTDDEIQYSVVGTRSGNPLGTCILDCFRDGIDAYFAFRNDQGGIYGRQLVVAEELDDELSKNQERALEIVSADSTFGVFNAALLASGWETLAEARIPTYVWSINFPDMAGHETIWGNGGVTCIACSQRGTIYAATLGKATKVAALGYGVTANSRDCVESQKRSIERHGGEVDIEVVYANGELPYGLPNGIAPEVTAMKDAGADFIITCIDLNGTKTLAQELERQGMADVPMLHQNTYDQAFVQEAGNLFEGDIMLPRFRPFEATVEGSLADYFEWIDKTGAESTELAMVGWINAATAYQGLVEAGPDLDREKVIAGTNALTAFSADGLVNPIDWSRQHVPATEEDPVTNGYANECVNLVKVVDGQFELIGDPDKPFLCWDNSTRDWSEPVATDVE